MSSPVTITTNNGQGEAKVAIIQVEDDAPLSAVRAQAQKEGIMSLNDLFNKGKFGTSLNKEEEENTLWTAFQNPQDKSVHVGLAAGKKFSVDDGLSEYQMKSIIQRCHIGYGFDPSGDLGPRYTHRPVIAPLSAPEFEFSYHDEGKEDVISTYSLRTSNYLKEGWVDADLAVKTPWDVDFGLDISHSQSFSQTTSKTHIYVAGRYSYGHAVVSLKPPVTQLEPHPDFKKAIDDALAMDDERERIEAVRGVLSYYGTMFPTAVEVGGMKQIVAESDLNEQTTESTVTNEMKLTLDSIFASTNFGFGQSKTETQTSKDWIKAGHWYTIGGDVEATDLNDWRKSLSYPNKWDVTRVMQVESVLSLFDKQTRGKIAHAALRAPLYLFRNVSQETPNGPTTGKHCLNTDSDPANIPFNPNSPYSLWGRIGTILTAPLDGAAPLYLLFDGNRYACTNQVQERQKFFTEGFSQQAVIGYVHTTQTAGDGRIPLHRLWNLTLSDNAYATDDKEIAALKAQGYNDEAAYFTCYVYPA
ncbi:hypothetical protein FRB90_002395 [Tulasnella sp. 427]|nr:hypothetical protein FRB90_002395 [Tulasnella sp. 427]